MKRNRNKISKLHAEITEKNKLLKGVQSKFKLQIDKVIVAED